MKLQASRKIRFIPPSGEPVLLEPGVPTIVPDAVGTELLAKAGTYLTRLPEHWTDGPHDPASPIQPGWFVVFRKDGRLIGGPEDGDKGRVLKSLYHAGDWQIFTHGHTVIPGRLVVGVQKVVDGRLLAAWTTRDHGLTGEKTSPPMLRDLDADKQAQFKTRFGWSDAVFSGLAHGSWSEAAWDEFWRTEP